MKNKLNRRDCLKYLGLSTAGLIHTPFSSARETASSKKWNFVFILVDDMGWSDLSCYGADLHETPNIDKFAGECMRFTDAYAASPVCTPTRASIMTGKYPARLHMTVWREETLRPPRKNRKMIPPQAVSNLPHSETTIAEALQSAGYQTAHIGKWHLGGAEHYPETQGFDVNIGGTLWGAPNTYFYPYSGSDYYGHHRYVPGLAFGEKGEYLTDRLTTEAMNLMDKMQHKPFLLHLAYHTVHSPIEGKPELVEYYQKKLKEGMNHKSATYAAMVHALDQNVGRLLGKIDELKLADNTVVILFSDNGGVSTEIRGKFVTSNHPLRSGKGSLYEGGIREPLLIKWPGVTKPGSICHEPVCSTDFYPTMLDIAGSSGDSNHNQNIDGISITPLLKNPASQLPRKELYWHFPHYYSTTSPVSAVRQGDWKLLEYYEDGHLELYNLKDDLGEQKNLVEKHPTKATELKTLLSNWRKNIDAQLPVVNQGE